MMPFSGPPSPAASTAAGEVCTPHASGSRSVRPSPRARRMMNRLALGLFLARPYAWTAFFSSGTLRIGNEPSGNAFDSEAALRRVATDASSCTIERSESVRLDRLPRPTLGNSTVGVATSRRSSSRAMRRTRPSFARS
jgi:hypothetical protein